MNRLAQCCLVVALLLVVSAPSMAAMSGADKAAEGMLKMDKALKGISDQLDAVMLSLNGLQNSQGSDLVSRYKEYSKQVDKTEAMAKQAQSAAKAANEKRDAYLAAWQKDQEKIVNPELKAAAQARKGELQPMIDQLKTSMASAKEQYVPLMQNLKDLRLFLGNDLSPAGLTTAQPLITKCNESTASVKADIDKGSAAIQSLAARFQPGGGAK